ncbi:c-type cytochrome [Gemmatimonas sp.]|jgi:mono/diheme cytochrome c family protein|uniref:c-type cytochrome n=1 Tax=Gemmatimonas sp. TaxID=1962908 RepID=UPI0037C04D47
MSPEREQLPPRQREYEDPDERVRPLPKILGAVIVGMFAWGAWYLAGSTPELDATLGDGRTAAGFAVAPAGAVSGAQVYVGKCAGCHQANGAGVAGVFPPLAASPWVTGSEARLVQILLHGIQGPIDVLGATYNGLMPAWKSLSDDEIAAVATYVRESFGNSAPAVTTATVAAERQRTAGMTTPWSGGAALDTIQ